MKFTYNPALWGITTIEGSIYFEDVSVNIRRAGLDLVFEDASIGAKTLTELYNGSDKTFDELTDTSVSSRTTDDYLKWNNDTSTWDNETPIDISETFVLNASLGTTLVYVAGVLDASIDAVTQAALDLVKATYIPDASLGTTLVYTAGVLDASIDSVTSLEALTDTSVAGRATDDYLKWNNDTSTWDNETPIDISNTFVPNASLGSTLVYTGGILDASVTVIADASIQDLWEYTEGSINYLHSKDASQDVSLNAIWTALNDISSGDYYVERAGDTMTGDLSINAHLYVDGSANFTDWVAVGKSTPALSPLDVYSDTGDIMHITRTTQGTFNLGAGSSGGVSYLRWGLNGGATFNIGSNNAVYVGSFSNLYTLGSGDLGLTGEIHLENEKIIGLAVPTDSSDGANKYYVDQEIEYVDTSILYLETNKLDNTTDTFTGMLTVNGSLAIFGDIYQDGSTYVVSANTLDVSDAFINLRVGAAVALQDGSISGVRITKPNGTNDVIFGAANDAVMRIGWEGDTLQAVATREDNPTDNWYTYWDDSSTMFKTYDLKSDLDSSLSTIWTKLGYVDTSISDLITYTDGSLNDRVERHEWYQNGFHNAKDASISFNETTRVFDITPSSIAGEYVWYALGLKHTVTEDASIQIPDSEGLHVIYYSNSAGLATALNPSHEAVDNVIEKTAIIAYIQWDATNNLGKLMYELHGSNMSPATHHWLHDNMGAQFRDGMSLTDLVVDATGDDDVDAQFGVTAGEFYDEDIENELLDVVSTEGLEIWYLEGTDWRWITNPGFSVRSYLDTSTNRLAWNDAGTQTEVDNNDFVLCHIFATNITEGTRQDCKFIAVQGQFEYNTKLLARVGADVEINNLVYGSLPLEEVIPVATVIFQSSSGDDGLKGRIVSTDAGDDYVDWRSSNLKASGGVVTDHGTLAGLNDNDHGGIYHTQTYIDGSLGLRDASIIRIDASLGDYVRKDGDTMTGSLIINASTYSSSNGLFFGDGDTGIYESADDNLRISLAGTEYYRITTAEFGSSSGSGGRIRYSGASATVPVFIVGSEIDTGIGIAGTNQLSLIAGAIETLRVTTTGANINIYPTDASHAVHKFYVDSSFALITNIDSSLSDVWTELGDLDSSLDLYVEKAGDTMTGTLTIQDASLIVNDGNVEILGDLAATTKSFLIKHPTKEGMKLQYGNLEGPEHAVYHRGRIIGTDTIELPEYWSELTREESVSVQLTSNKPHLLYVKEITKDTVKVKKIGFGKIDCFYTVYGERKDVNKLKTERE